MNKFFNAAAIGVVALLAAVIVTPAQAANNHQNKHQVKALDQQTAAKLSKAQKELKNKKYDDALSNLKKLEKSKQKDHYALALTEQMIAYVYIDQEKYKQALPYLRKTVELNALPKQAQHDATLTLAQLYAQDEQYHKAISLLEKWFRTEKNPPISAYVLAATSYYNTDDYHRARKYIKIAIEKAKKKKGEKPHEDWYGLLVGVDYKLKNYDEAIDTLRTMISYWPNKAEYWRNLYGLYLLQNKKKEALVVMRVAYDKGMIKDGDELLNLARLEVTHDLPYYAGEVLTKGMKDGKIKSNLDNLQLLVTAWTQARETGKALATLDKAAALSKDGELYLKKARLCYSQADWKCTINASGKAMKKGGLDEPGKAYILKGMALAQNKKFSQAKQAFGSAKKYKGSRKEAGNWIKYIDNTLAALKTG
jgi:tetratricopeptide (TPR) repeat protein